MKLNTVKVGMFVMAASLTLGTVSCKKEGCTDETATNYDSKAKKDDGSCEYEVAPVAGTVNKAGNITANETWTADNIYIITGKVVVNSGVTLTIQPGTIIKGAEGTGTLASALVVAQGGKINAVGTASQPIIFTSVLDNIQVGQLTGTNLDENDQGLWGGLIILGYAPISAADGDVLSQIEGIPASDAFGAFGGSNSSDDSGDLAYISIRHGGALIGAGNEINGLTLGGVGSGTSISNIEVVSNLDDGIEFFGGTVNVSNVLIGHQGDDGIDIDMNYAGTVTNFVVINGVNSDKSLEIDGPEGTTYTSGLFTLLNGTTNGNGDFKSKAQGTTNNVKMGVAKIRASYQNACADPKTDAFTYLTQGSPTLVFTGAEFSSVLVYTASDDGGNPATGCTVFAADQTAAEGAMTSTTATGFASTGFASWTWMGVNNKL
ncbi:MAG: hypothetical protein NWR50_03090 [Crocinitomicaceae bacterium]|jgi:hypothetical protein|nr:hypothetical protein [Crocinitomicaceae bacterium]